MEASSSIALSPFDNELSVIYKYAQRLGVPARYVLVFAPQHEPPSIPAELMLPASTTQGYQYASFVDVVTTLVTGGSDLITIYNALVDPLQHPLLLETFEESLALIFITVRLEQGHPVASALNEANAFFTLIGMSLHFDTEEEYTLRYNAWSENYGTLYEQDQQRLRLLLSYQQQLSLVQPVAQGPVVIETAVVRATPVIRPKPEPGISNAGLSLFDRSRVNPYVPFLRYNPPRTVTTRLTRSRRRRQLQTAPPPPPKIYAKISTDPVTTSPSGRNLAVLNKVVRLGPDADLPNTFILTVWSDPGPVGQGSIEMYTVARYNLDDNALFVRSPVGPDQGVDIVLDRLAESLNADLSQYTFVRLSGRTVFYDVALYESYLLYLILNDPVFAAYIYVPETISPASDHRRVDIRFRSVFSVLEEPDELEQPAAAAATFATGMLTADETVTLIVDGQPTTVTYPAGTTILTVSITGATSGSVLDQFMTILGYLLRRYLDNINPAIPGTVASFYAMVFPGVLFEPRLGTATSQAPGNQTRGNRQTKALELSRLAPDLAITSYPRLCQQRAQPVIIPEDQVEAWTAQTFLWRGRILHRQALPFPPERPRWYFGCPPTIDPATGELIEVNPFPGVKVNTLTNRDLYPIVPCCYKKDHMAPGANTVYNEYYRGQQRSRDTARLKHVMRTNKILIPGQEGFLAPTIVDTVRAALSRAVGSLGPTNEVRRYGVPPSLSSLLHCVCIATDEPNYVRLSTNDEREAYVIQLRQHLAQQIEPAVCKQELFDQSDETIRSNLADPKIFLDPQYYYRAVETWFGIDLYVFTQGLTQTGRSTESTGHLELPRARFVHIRSERPGRFSVVILKHIGARITGRIVTPAQCELVVSYDPNQFYRLFPPESSSVFRSVLLATQSVYQWQTDVGSDLPVARLNLFSSFNPRQVFPTAIAQVIDPAGKMRGLVLPGDDPVTVTFPPAQPEDLPIREQWPECLSSTAIKLFGPPTASSQEGGRTVGLWFPIFDLTQGLYVPIRDEPNQNGLPMAGPDPIFQLLTTAEPGNQVVGTSITSRIRLLRRQLVLLLQLVLWTFLLSQTEVDPYIQRYWQIEPDGPDTAQIYDFRRLPEQLPYGVDIPTGPAIEQPTPLQPLSVDRALDWIQTYQPLAVQKSRLRIIGPKLEQGLRYYLNLYLKTTIPSLRTLPHVITGLYQDPSDFTTQPETIIFTNLEQIRNWLTYIQRQSLAPLTIRTRLNLSYGAETEPYLWISPPHPVEGSLPAFEAITVGRPIYLIQNVLDGARYRALNVAATWSRSGRNLGYFAPVDHNLTSPFVIYGVGKDGGLVLLEDHRVGTAPFLQLLDYNASRYAAMMPLT